MDDQISNSLMEQNNQLFWNFHFHRDINDRLIDDLTLSLDISASFHPSPLINKRIFLSKKKKGFTILSFSFFKPTNIKTSQGMLMNYEPLIYFFLASINTRLH